VSWSKRFDEPIVLPYGAKLATLRDAVAHLGKTIPKSEHVLPSGTAAAECLTLAAETWRTCRVRTLCDATGTQSASRARIYRPQSRSLGPPQAQEAAMTKVWIYESGDTIKKFASEDEANARFKIHDPEGVAWAYELGPVIPAGKADEHGVPVAEK
jgi:hypothetical protein